MTTQPYISEELSVDFDSHQAVVQGERVKLTPTEYKLLYFLIRNPRQIMTNDAILKEVWDEEYQDSEGLVKSHIQRLRKKLKDDIRSPRLIITERGRGYRFVGADYR